MVVDHLLREEVLVAKHGQPVIEVVDLHKTYKMGEVLVEALRGVDFRVAAGEVVAIIGPSGSGKSTMMSILGCLDRPSSGRYLLEGEEVSQLTDLELADVRNRKIGFVFQKFHLLNRATALSNVELPLRYARKNGVPRREKAVKALAAVGLEDRMNHRPSELSGGQQQRVAIARAIVNSPTIIMADEPTGNLDTKSGDEVMNLLLSMNKQLGTTLIIITHDADIASKCQRVVTIRDGEIQKEKK